MAWDSYILVGSVSVEMERGYGKHHGLTDLQVMPLVAVRLEIGTC